MNQHTIKKNAKVKGIGLHTGAEVTLTFKPAPENHGYQFKRIDLEGAPTIMADVSKVCSTNRSTSLESNGAKVITVEHVLSALRASNIDNVLIEINGAEIPILDGSAEPFMKALKRAGKQEQDAEREYFEIKAPISYKDEQTGTEIIALPAEEFSITTLIDFNSPILGTQYAQLDDMKSYKKEIAPSRTFVFVHELEQLLKQNLIKGGSLDNAVVIADKPLNSRKLSSLSKKLGKNDVKIAKEGILNTTSLRFSNEPARHKLLDVIGDLALLGKFIKGKIIATRPGHTSNVEFVKILKNHYLEEKKKRSIPVYNPSVEPICDVVKIASMLPHRFPFLLIDKIIEMSPNHVVGVKNVTFNENYFQGHFPNNPVMPGVLQIEAMAQTGGILALSTVPDPENWDTYFLKIDKAKFKQKVVPGDTILFKMELIAPIRRGIVQMRGTAFVGGQLVSEGDLVAQIVRRKV